VAPNPRTLREKQHLFASLVPRLIDRALALGYAVTLGEVYRSPEEAARRAALGIGLKTSLHCDKLALDLHLFKDGVYLTRTEDHAALGRWWEQQHPLCRWGGRFQDGNHYSVTHFGRR
jgi:hypothetical protein